MVSLYKLQEGDDLLGDIIVKKHRDYFRIVFTDEYNCLFTDHQGKAFKIEHIDNNGIFDSCFVFYHELGVKNIEELFLLIVRNPREIINLLTGNNIPVYRLIVEYFQD